MGLAALPGYLEGEYLDGDGQNGRPKRGKAAVGEEELLGISRTISSFLFKMQAW